MKEYRDLLRSTSRTFAVGIEALPGRLRDAVTLAYLVLRVSDYYEDSPTLPPDRKEACLHAWARLVETGERDPAVLRELERCIADADRDLPDHRAACNAGGILDGVAALPPDLRAPIRDHTGATTRGMAEWVRRGDDFPDEAALDAYMFEVAGRVGLLLTDLFTTHSQPTALRREALLETAVSFGLGLQTVNVIRGLHEDPNRGWTFVPRHVLPAHARSGELAGLEEPDRAQVLDFLVEKAAHHIADALRYCGSVPRVERGIRIFCIIPALLASRTAALSAGNPRVFREPVKVGRAEVGRIVLGTRLLWFSNGWLERERERVLSLAASGPC